MVTKKINWNFREGRKDSKKVEKTPLKKTHSLSVPFGDTSLSSVFSSTYINNAARLLNSGNVVKTPGDHKGFLVASDTDATPYIVESKGKWSLYLSV